MRSRVRTVAAGRRVGVIGGGLGGLATALRLAYQGWQVILLERYQRLGGKMNLLETDGFRMDTGPSLITMPWALEELFRAVDERLEDHVRLIPVSPLCRYVFADGSVLEMTPRLPDWLPHVQAIRTGEASGFLQFVSLGARMLDLSLETFFRTSPRDLRPAELLRMMTRRTGFLPMQALRPYASVVSGLCRDRRTRQVLNRYATYVGSDPRRIWALFSIIPAMELLYGGFHIAGGLYRLVEALEQLCVRMGVEIRTDAHVQRILTDGRRVQALELRGGETVPVDVAVMNGDVARLPELLGRRGPAPAPWQRSLSGIVFLFGLHRRLEGMPHHQVFFSADYDAEFDDLFRSFRFPQDPTVYVNIPTRTDPSMASDGCEVVFIMANAPAGDELTWDEAMLVDARRRMARRLAGSGLDEVMNHEEPRAIVTPAVLAERFDMPGGAIYGRNCHGFGGAMRPPNRYPGVRGLYCVGGSTHPGGGVPTVILSARIVSEMIQRDARS